MEAVMPMSVNFRWKTPNVIAAKADPNGVGEGLSSLGEAIARMKASRYAKEQQDRRNAIEDENRAIAAEDRARAISEQDRRNKAYGEAADLIRGRYAERERLLKERAEVVAQINDLKARMGL